MLAKLKTTWNTLLVTSVTLGIITATLFTDVGAQQTSSDNMPLGRQAVAIVDDK